MIKVDRVNEWNDQPGPSMLCFIVDTRREAVRLSNALRNKGYTIEFKQMGGYQHFTVHRLKNSLPNKK